MFVQVIEGRASDAEGLKRQMNRWQNELRPGAAGHLGSTGGVTAEGQAVILARFDSFEAAQANSGRPEQGEWWAETEKCFDGEVAFTDSSDVTTLLGGGSNDAGFVQILKDESADRAVTEELDVIFAEHAPTFRPDVMGGLRVWTGPTSYVEAAYFTSEEAARAAENSEPPPAMAERMSEYSASMENVEFLDLTDPWLF